MSRIAVLILLSLGMFSLPVSAADSEAQRKAQDAFDSLYGADVKRVRATKDTADDAARAAKLLEAARAVEAQPGLLAILSTNVCELAAAVPIATAAKPATNKAEVPADGTAVWELWLPPNGMPVRAVVVCPRWGDGARMVKLVQENLGAKLGVGTMLSWRDAEILEQFKDPAFVASITNCLARSAVKLKRPELANVPLLLWAHSNAAWYLQNSLKIMPERVAAYCLFKSAFGKNNDLGTMSKDAVAAFGQSIWDENDRIGKGYDNPREKKLMLDNLAAARKQGALVHVTLVRGTHHVIDGQEKLMLAFFESAIALRIPRGANPAKGPVKLVSGLEKIGWIQDESSKTVYAPGRYPAGKDPRRGWWLPTREYAEAWNAYALNAKGTVAAPDTPVPKALPAGNAP